MTPVEAIHLSLTEIEKHLGDAVEAVQSQAEAQENVAGNVDKLMRSHVELGEKIDSLATMLGNYVEATAASRRETAKLQSEVRTKLKIAGP